ncbi:hypothetical protein U3A58_06380 [Algoriphagus sp. C2-6-M1]|uniref:hypothetical protein n=1 Tax=Algoriphagus persicinus TaxID=3108754 RepID=UPI002B3B6F30|nr:hypothetical protein [Algoriphagus sp. C2-6-M1]MEB2780011.1 hypothetical protein [Algoriphagus sp. C2-6-M1]
MELFDDFKEFIKERTKNPFLGSLTFFWILFNWKALFILFLSDSSVEHRISLVSFSYLDFWTSLFFPTSLAVIYTLVIPHIFHLFEKGTARIYNERKKTYYDKISKDYGEREIVARAKFDYEQAENGYKDQKELNEKISSLESKLREKEEAIENNKKQVSSLESDTNKLNQIINHQLTLLFNREEIKNLYTSFSTEELNEAGEAISTILTKLGEITDYDKPEYINIINKFKAGDLIINKSLIVDFKLNTIGYFLFFRFFYIDQSVSKHYYSVFPGQTLK